MAEFSRYRLCAYNAFSKTSLPTAHTADRLISVLFVEISCRTRRVYSSFTMLNRFRAILIIIFGFIGWSAEFKENLKIKSMGTPQYVYSTEWIVQHLNFNSTIWMASQFNFLKKLKNYIDCA